jgi:hypothetical protein
MRAFQPSRSASMQRKGWAAAAVAILLVLGAIGIAWLNPELTHYIESDRVRGLLARPTAAAVLVVINVLRFMVMEWFGFSAGRAMQLPRLELRPPSAWRRRPSDSLLLLQPCGFWLVRRTTVRGPG